MITTRSHSTEPRIPHRELTCHRQNLTSLTLIHPNLTKSDIPHPQIHAHSTGIAHILRETPENSVSRLIP